jgi:hypothetical protein
VAGLPGCSGLVTREDTPPLSYFHTFWLDLFSNERKARPSTNIGPLYVIRNQNAADKFDLGPPAIKAATEDTTAPATNHVAPTLGEKNVVMAAGSVDIGPAKVKTHKEIGSLFLKTKTALMPAEKW